MAVPGRQPKPEGQKRHRNVSDVEWVEVEDVPYDGPRPEFPTTRVIITRNGKQIEDILPATRDWWDVVTTQPHCKLWSKADWQFALTTVQVADAAFCGIASAMTELRNREKVMGTTVEYRRALRIRYKPVADVQADPAGVTKIDDYRDL